jgi:hypothetical protein
VLWALSLAVQWFSAQGVDFAKPEPVSNDGCMCGVDHEAHAKLYEEFLRVSADAQPDGAVSAVVTALDRDLHQPKPDGFLAQNFGPMDLNHGERYFAACLFEQAMRPVALKMFTATA